MKTGTQQTTTPPSGHRSWLSLSLEPLQNALVEAQARRIRELERRLGERTRVLTDAALTLSGEISRREEAQAALFEAQKLEALGHLAGGLAHDLRNVLGVMDLGYQVLRFKSDDPDLLRVADNGERALKQAQGLIDGLLGLMRRREDDLTVVVPADWLTQMEDLLRYAAGRRVSLRLEIAPRVWPVRVVEHRLAAALLNLAVNSRDAMPDGGELTVAASNLEHGTPRPAQVPEGDLVVFSIADTGCGMSREVLARATDPLFTTKPPGKGTGLGLAMVRDFAAACGGHLAIASRPGKGTRVDLALPRAESAAEAGEPAPATADAPQERIAAPTGALLLVDDDDLIRTAIAGMLRAQGWQVVESSSAEVALALLPTLPRLAVVVADLNLPGADGATLVQRVRLERPGLPALFISGQTLTDTPLPGVPLLRKPFGQEALVEAVRAQMQRPVSARERHDTTLDRLIVRLRSPALLAALLAWRDARGPAPVPRLDALGEIAAELSPHSFLAVREGTAEAPSFRFRSVGAALTATLGRPLAGELVGSSGEDLAGTLAAAYHRAGRTGLPSYEYARYALGDGAPVLFERLILPAAEDGIEVTHLLGVVLIANLPAVSKENPAA